jgi:hypothetical protein
MLVESLLPLLRHVVGREKARGSFDAAARFLLRELRDIHAQWLRREEAGCNRIEFHFEWVDD